MAHAAARRAAHLSRAIVSATAFALIGALFAFNAGPALAASATWSPPVETSTGPGDTVGAVTAPDGTITTVVESYLTGIMAVSSTDGGATWQPPVPLGSGGDYAFRSTIGMTSTGLLAIAWVESAADVRSIWIVISADGGDTWSSPTALPTASNDFGVDDPSIGSSSPLGFTVVWKEDFAKLSSATIDGGTSWSAAVVVSEFMNSYGAGSLVTLGLNTIVVVYQEFNGLTAVFSIQSRRSTDGGVTWEPAVAVNGSSGNSVMTAAVSPSAGSLVVFWTHLSDAERLYAATSTDGGSTWGAAIEVSVDSESVRYFAAEVVDGPMVGIVWHQQSGDAFELYYAELTAGANSTSTPVLIDSSSALPYERLPTLTDFGATRVATWNVEGETESGYRSAVSCDGGMTWRDSTSIVFNGDVTTADAVVARSGTVVTAFWSEYSSDLEDYRPLASSIDDPCSVAVAAPDVDGPELAATGASDATIAGLVAALGMLAAGILVLIRRRAPAQQ